MMHAALLPVLLILPHTLATVAPKMTMNNKRAELELFEDDANMYLAMFRLSVQYMLFFGQRVSEEL